ncbi:hypothetical protein KSC_068110 [Ktedonobacter sp. SOSP1-52]|nr:hypothetical protein KSC_068110 [Ktedonobacter sp. SOSP1-52]
MAAHQPTSSHECKQEAGRLLYESGKKQQMSVQISISRVANCYGNAVMESFFATLKEECMYRTHL